jgi:hydrogenase maturation protease
MKSREIRVFSPPRTLVIGYGNELRGDDAVGPRVATSVAEWNLAGVTAQAVPQLTPELAEAIAQVQRVIFVDAADLEAGAMEVQVTPINPSEQLEWQAHLGDPRALLALTQAIYGSCPAAWFIAVPTGQFDYGTPLSLVAEQSMATALREIRRIVSGAEPANP